MPNQLLSTSVVNTGILIIFVYLCVISLQSFFIEHYLNDTSRGMRRIRSEKTGSINMALRVDG
jgi:hypothetical protein